METVVRVKSVSSCGQCSRECGGGERRRVVVCLSAGNLDLLPDTLCNMTARPSDVDDCNLHRCGTGSYASCCFITHRLYSLE